MKALPHLSVSAALVLSTPLAITSCHKQKSAVPPASAVAATRGKPSPVDAAAAEQAITATKDLVVVDLRTPEEFAAGHLKGAINIDFLAPDFAEKIANLDPAKPILVHCQSGGRSARALTTVETMAFPKILHLDGGFASWQAAGLPVEK